MNRWNVVVRHGEPPRDSRRVEAWCCFNDARSLITDQTHFKSWVLDIKREIERPSSWFLTQARPKERACARMLWLSGRHDLSGHEEALPPLPSLWLWGSSRWVLPHFWGRSCYANKISGNFGGDHSPTSGPEVPTSAKSRCWSLSGDCTCDASAFEDVLHARFSDAKKFRHHVHIALRHSEQRSVSGHHTYIWPLLPIVYLVSTGCLANTLTPVLRGEPIAVLWSILCHISNFGGLLSTETIDPKLSFEQPTSTGSPSLLNSQISGRIRAWLWGVTGLLKKPVFVWTTNLWMYIHNQEPISSRPGRSHVDGSITLLQLLTKKKKKKTI